MRQGLEAGARVGAGGGGWGQVQGQGLEVRSSVEAGSGGWGQGWGRERERPGFRVRLLRCVFVLIRHNRDTRITDH